MNANHVKNLALFSFIVLTSIVIGLSYGNSNQNTYLIHGLTQIKPNFLSGDWFAHSTHHYHDKFSYVLILVNYLGLPIDISLTVIEVALRIIALVAIYKIIYLITNKYAFMSFMIVLALVILERTNSVASSYIFSTMLQPSSFGSTFLLVGFLFFLRGRYFISGASIAFAGYMHTNVLLLGFVYLGIAHVVLGAEGLIKRGAAQFLPMAFVLAMDLPFLSSMVSSENVEKATYIFQFVRSPHHYVPSYYMVDFILFAGWSILGLMSLQLIAMENGLKRRLIGLYSSLLSIIVISTLLTTIVFIPMVSKLFFWRMAPFSVMLSQILFVTAIVNQAFSDKTESAVHFVTTLFFLLLGYLFIFRWYLYKYGLNSNKTLLLAGIAFCCGVLFLRTYIIARINPIYLSKNVINVACIGMLSLILAYEFSSSFYHHSTLLNGHPGKSESELYQWVKTTEESAIFLTPPRLENFRLHGERAIIADWKSTPVDPNGLIEWYKRIQDITGLIDIKSSKDVNEAYLHTNIDRVTFLKKKYGITYAVLYRYNNELNCNFPEVFKNETFVVLSLESS